MPLNYEVSLEVISEDRREPDDNEGRYYDEFTIVSRITGQLAERIRSKVGASPDAEVLVTEEQVDASWSEWTTDYDYSFKLTVDGKDIDFGRNEYMGKESSIGLLMRWLEGSTVDATNAQATGE